MSIRRIW